MTTVRGVVINVHGHGATVRLDDGSLAAVPFGELSAHRQTYVASYQKKTTLDLGLERAGRHSVAFLATSSRARRAEPPSDPVAPDVGDGEIVRVLHVVDAPGAGDALFEHRIAAYLKSTEAWAPPDRPAPDERHAERKKKRAAFFERRKPRV